LDTTLCYSRRTCRRSRPCPCSWRRPRRAGTITTPHPRCVMSTIGVYNPPSTKIWVEGGLETPMVDMEIPMNGTCSTRQCIIAAQPSSTAASCSSLISGMSAAGPAVSGSVALSFFTTAHPLYTIFSQIICTAFPETTMRPSLLRFRARGAERAVACRASPAERQRAHCR
jgi:hypothetical protein